MDDDGGRLRRAGISVTGGGEKEIEGNTMPEPSRRGRAAARGASSLAAVAVTAVCGLAGPGGAFVHPGRRRAGWAAVPRPTTARPQLPSSSRTEARGTPASFPLHVATEEGAAIMAELEMLGNGTLLGIALEANYGVEAAEIIEQAAEIIETPHEAIFTEGTKRKEDVEEEEMEGGGPPLSPHVVDVPSGAFPSVPVSYGPDGSVQAAPSPFMSAIELADASPITTAPSAASGVEVAAIQTEDDEVPELVRALFRRDESGRTPLAKLFNAALLAASFGYVAYTVLNIDRGMTRGWTAGEIGMRIPLDTWASYENSLSEKPVATKTIINIVIYLLGDWLSQTIFTGANVLDFDARRTLRNGFIGACFGPVVHEYYEFSDSILPVDGATLGITNRAFKILMDQTLYLSVKCSIYILAVGVLSGEGLEDSAENVRTRIRPIMFTAWKFWPLVHCVTYGLIPARHRILWVNSGEFF